MYVNTYIYIFCVAEGVWVRVLIWDEIADSTSTAFAFTLVLLLHAVGVMVARGTCK